MADIDLIVAGGGPAGMMAGLLFARAGLHVVVLEKHADFLRDFRGDTVHPSTLELMRELGLLDGLLARPHNRIPAIGANIDGRAWPVADFRRLNVTCRFIATMPQWDFLNYLAESARRYPGFDLRMTSEVEGIVTEGERIAGVRLKSGETLRAQLVIAADGRGSVLRAAAGLPLRDLGAPIDVFWFRVPKTETPVNQTAGTIGNGHFFVTIDRGDYWQCAFVIGKGQADVARARGLEAFRADLSAIDAGLAVSALTDWDQVKLLSVSLDRLERWHRPGLLAIGDAAHAMSPVGGVGVNLAVQDAVAAANILAGPMARGEGVDDLLGQVQARRMLPTRIVQAVQRTVHESVIGPVLAGGPVKVPLALRLLKAIPPLQAIPARVVGLGFRREHVRSPEA